MLIDNEDESLSELDVVEQKNQLPEVAPLSEMPEKTGIKWKDLLIM